MKYQRVVAIAVVAVSAATILASALYAGDKQGKKPAPKQDKKSAPREVTLTGKVVDLHCYMTERFPSADAVKCTRECIRVGVPAALETDDGLIIIGKGLKGPARDIAPLALQNVELKGKLYERHGLRYIDIISAKVVKKTPPVEEEPETDESETGEWDSDEPDDPNPYEPAPDDPDDPDAS
ncbi:MAG: hypothetical protein KAV82_05765 [Phycisphaerae bacterium]|nr:hypothetical protein [Phycisphaerae bacterium]